ncbi:hypothetical protein AB5V95_01045 [Metamycoplasma spumans]|uniref:hypothetical protein n=1 Tax=Metamycoplasma spumans TaxID=92406 RepID=UPI00048834BB
MKKNKKLLIGLSTLIPMAIAPVAISCFNESNDNNDSKSNLFLSESQLSEVHNAFEFKKTEAGLEASDSTLVDTIEKLNREIKGRKAGFLIKNEAEFKKYFYLKVPDMARISTSHTLNISFSVDPSTKNIQCNYEVICVDRNNALEASNTIVLEDN